uniref:Uncharacterized protein n=1 Tax=Rhizophora mucronata TaxID=61149 RepID=A0A2P2IR45_RHIMU
MIAKISRKNETQWNKAILVSPRDCRRNTPPTEAI